MPKKDKDKKGPSTQPTSTNGVNAVGVNHGMTRQEAVKPTPQQAMAQMSQTVAPQPVQVVQQQAPTQTAVNPQQNPVSQPVQTASAGNGYTYEQAAEGMKRFHGNVDLYHRPVVSSEAMNKAGYNIPSGNTATVYSMQRGIRDANGNVREILYTPISADGQVMSQRDIDAYIDSLDGSDDILAADRAGRNMIIHMDANPNGNDGQDLHLMQEAYGRGPQQQGSVQPAPQQIVLPNQITMPGGRVINMQPQQQATAPMKIGNNTYQVPTGQVVQPTPEETSARQQQINTDYALDNGVAPNAVRPHGDIQEPEAAKQAREQVETSQANAQERAAASQASDEDEYQKTLKEYLDSKYESPEDREQREKREARQRRWAAISEGLANVFNVGGAVAGAQPAQWESGVGDLYANQEAESDKRRLEYRQALKDLIDYHTAIRNGDIARARAIEDKRKNDIYEYRIMQEQEAKAAERKLKAEAQEKEQARKDQDAKNRQRKADDDHLKAKQQLEGTYKPSGNTKKSSSGGKGRGRSGGSRATGAAAAKSAKAAAKRRAKAATQGTKFGKK